jgi:spore maturation protein B
LILREREAAKISFTFYIIPLIVGLIVIIAMVKKVAVFDEFLAGAWENIKVAVTILPALLGLMTAINMLRASGALDFISQLISPLTDFLGFPRECVSLALIRPVSGSGAISVYEGILRENGPDGFVGRVSSVLLGSTETTFYTIAVYFGVTKIKKTRQTLLASLSADFTGFVFSALTVRLIFG